MRTASGIALARGAPGTEIRADPASTFSPCRSLREKPVNELLAAIRAGDERGCVRLLKGLNETARRALHPAVAQENAPAARIAMLGTATLGELRKSAPCPFPAD